MAQAAGAEKVAAGSVDYSAASKAKQARQGAATEEVRDATEPAGEISIETTIEATKKGASSRGRNTVPL